MIRLWLNLFFGHTVTKAELGYLRERPGADGFHAPKFDPALDIAQGGTGVRENQLARLSEAMNSTNKF
jgi:hypothetical protein